MNDRFKFRAWDKLEEYMVCEIEAIDFTSECITYFRHDLDEYFEPDIKDIILMQCTSLKDKDDKLIMEGDIIVLNCGNEDLICPVVWHEDYAEFDLKHPKGFHGHYSLSWKIIDSCNKFEIIGNIHENPEKLNEEEK